MATQDAPGAMGKPSSPFAFVDTIDYIFTNDGDGRAAAWKVKAVGRLPSKADAAAVCESYPTADEPSDHLLLCGPSSPFRRCQRPADGARGPARSAACLVQHATPPGRHTVRQRTAQADLSDYSLSAPYVFSPIYRVA